MSHQCTKELFLKDTKDHVLRTIRDADGARHIRFHKPGTLCTHFDLITWPGHLCYTGDMGTYVFSRLEDMFEFFRPSPDREFGRDIDRRYWAEKLLAVDSSGGKGSATEFSPEKFKRVINEYRVDWMRERVLNKDQRRELWDEIETQVLEGLDEGEHAVYARANEFSHNIRCGDLMENFSFTDLWDHQFTEYTFHFTWCCYALAWGIQKYDESKQ